MPNWCDNDLYIYGKHRTEIADAIANGENVIDFEKIVPMPPGLIEIMKGSTSSDAEILLGWRDPDGMLGWDWVKAEGISDVEGLKAYLVKNNPDLPAIAEKMKALKEETGYSDWYQFAIERWGTKWNTDGGSRDDGRTRICLTFHTAWSPPMPIVDALAKKYPKTRFSLRYYECGMGFRGHYEVKGDDVLWDDYWEDYRGNRGG